MRASLIQDSLLDTTAALSAAILKTYKKDGEKLIAEVYREQGKNQAETLKKRLGLGSSLKDAVDAWKIAGNLTKLKAKFVKNGENSYDAYHLDCPMHEAFKKYKISCGVACLPMVEALATNICPEAKMTVIRKPTLEQTCVKRLTL
jgi:predicted ArsR family transcriptional regulator